MRDARREGPLDLLPRWPLVVVITLVVLAIGVVTARWYVRKRAARALIVPSTDTTGPGNPGVPYADLMLPGGDHAIHAWWVRAPTLDSAGPAVLLFHSHRSTLGDQAGIQQVLYRAGISSLAFDYSGFGKSGGEATPAALRHDARTAFAVFSDSARAAARRVLLGTSLGAAVMLDAIADIQNGVDGVVLVGAFTSAREVAIRSGRIPPVAGVLIPRLYDNLLGAQRLTTPLLVVHSAQDEVFPIDHAERLLEAAPVPKRLVRLDRGGHGAYLSSDADWVPVLQFIKQGLDVRP